ncbi:uncharacterized protein DUF1127 [Dongia mobilis]|uniref:Uncharacterized protein DUF1127 n=1 Tax=Dongia mobilis TaxID=578943 RepID=A0A4R6WXY6_9PROT|nr:DUF1127 domain-containing protein [Dongia mobilis]TDQ84577.1 uncharacterized protein DUF1127 [Dongia mobilis]
METTIFLKVGNRQVSPYQPVVWLALALRHFVDQMIKRRNERRSIAVLSAMSDYQLRDLGIGRSQIVRTVRQGRPASDF